MSQFHNHFRPTLLAKALTLYHRLRGAKIGEGSIVLQSSKIERFPANITIGSSTIIKNAVKICSCNKEAKIKIGNNCTVGDYGYIYSSEKITIGDNTLIGPFCYLVDANHGISRDKSIRSQPLTTAAIVIEEDCWIGANVTVLSGVKLRKGSVVAAGSIVTKDTEQYSINAGNPARQIGERKHDNR